MSFEAHAPAPQNSSVHDYWRSQIASPKNGKKRQEHPITDINDITKEKYLTNQKNQRNLNRNNTFIINS
jgi:hypothetical protein